MRHGLNDVGAFGHVASNVGISDAIGDCECVLSVESCVLSEESCALRVESLVFTRLYRLRRYASTANKIARAATKMIMA